MTARTRTPSVETLIKRRKAQDEKLRAALEACEADIATLQARRAELRAMLGEAPASNGAAEPKISDRVKCADCGAVVSGLSVGDGCPACHASPFEEER